jgi:hypothetical protein
MKCKTEKGLILFLIVFTFGNSLFSQTRNLIWKDSDMRKGQKFPFAYINDSTSIENEINDYFKNKYLNQSDSYRDNFNEYKVSYMKTNICGIAITYEHEFNTSPGLWSFTDNNYFDLRNGNIIDIKSLIDVEKYDAFIKIVNDRKNTFVQDFKKGLTKEQEEYERLIGIADDTLYDSIDSSDIDNLSIPYAMSGNYKLTLYADYLELSYYWEYGWGLGRQSLPNIILKFTYKELTQFFNDDAKELLIMPIETQDKK